MTTHIRPTRLAGQSAARSRARVRRREPAALLAASLLLLLLVAAPTGTAAAAAAYRMTGSVERISDPSMVIGARAISAAQQVAQVQAPDYFVVTAVPVDGQQLLSFTLEATGGVPVVASEIAIDPVTSRMVLAVGRPTDASLRTLQQLQAAGMASSSVATSPGKVTTLAAWRSTHGFFSTFWTDPVGLTVNSVIDEAHWQYNGTKVQSLTGNDSRQWLTANGWAEVSHSIAAYYNSGSTVGTVYTNDHFRTSSWFPCGPTGAHDTWYQANNVYGFADGHTGGGVNTWATGPCRGLLSVTAFASPGK